MTARLSLRTRDLALAGGISVQQVRNYEASGLIPKAQRSSSGYRLYTQQHLAALKTVKSMVRGYGWPRTSAIMQALHRGELSAALAIIDECHAELARKRLQMEMNVALRQEEVCSCAFLPLAMVSLRNPWARVAVSHNE